MFFFYKKNFYKEAGQKPQIARKSNKTRDDLDPQKKSEWLIWLSKNWETYFADDRHTASWSIRAIDADKCR